MKETERLLFLKEIYPHALRIEKELGFNAIALMAQAAGECGWKKPPGNMYFGIKDTDGLNGNEQLIRTKEILNNPYKKFPIIHSIISFLRGKKTYYIYDVETYFRKYDSPYESFLDHANFILNNERYKEALNVKDDPKKFLQVLADNGYATSLDYGIFMSAMVDSVTKRLNKLSTV